MNVRRGRPISHGMRYTRIWRIWAGMIGRCYTPSNTSYPLYGAKGITVCDRWHDFKNFFSDMGGPPSRNHQLERANNLQGYSPANCKWATVVEQGRNRSTTTYLTWNGETLCVSEWADRYGIPRSTLRQRIRYGHKPPELFKIERINAQ